MTASNPRRRQQYQGIGVPEDSLSSILQRGGEELAIDKVPDRFTLKLSHPQQTVQDLPSSAIAVAYLHSVSPGVKEVQVKATDLDEAMHFVRQSDQTQYASHIYQIQGDVDVLYLTNQITILFANELDEFEREAIANAFGLRYLKPVDGINQAYVYELTAAATENPIKISNRLTWNPLVLMAEPNIVVKSQSFYYPSDSLYPQQWYLHSSGNEQQLEDAHIFVETAWDITRGSRSIVVAVTDDSVDLNHPDFQGFGKIVAPLDLKDQDFLPLPETVFENHGTACAGIAVAEENGEGIVGVAPGCALMPIRTSGYLDDESIEKIFNWAIEKGAAVISCSWGASGVYFPLSLRQRAAMTKAVTTGRNGKGCVVVFAAGNANRPINGRVNEQGWPNNTLNGETKWLSGFAIHPDVITVSACTSFNQKSAYSNWGNGISVCAPSNNEFPKIWLPNIGFVNTPPIVLQQLAGLGILTTDRTGATGYDQADYTATFGGTSSAAPVVAGIAALMLSANPNLTAQQVREMIQQTADKIVDPQADLQLGYQLGDYDAQGYSQWFGYGKVNAEKAVKLAQTQPIPQVISRSVQQQNKQIYIIPDNDPLGVSSEIVVTEASLIQGIQVSVNIEHQYLGDLSIELFAPNGQTILLQNRNLGTQTQLKQIYTLNNSPFLAQLLQLSAAGKWRLVIIDHVICHTGQLQSWGLTLEF